MKFDQRIERTLKSNLFFVLCLLHSLGTVLLLVDGNVSVLNIRINNT